MNAKEFVDVVRKASEEKTKSYDTTAIVKRVEGDTLWVHIAGGTDETPVRRTVDAKAGDTVQIRVANGDAWAQGNGTAPPTDDTAANAAQETADGAERMARTAAAAADAAEAEAGRAKAAADDAQETAESVHDIAVQASEDAAAASTAAATADSKATAAGTAAAAAQSSADAAASAAATADSKADAASAAATRAEGKADAASTAASRAETAANDASTAAASAQTSADGALVGLSTVQDVVGVLNWITAHGTMTSQSGGTFDENQAYFIQDNNGDYTVGGIRYSLVAEPTAADINSYYVLTVDESVQNYVATHIVVDGEGLWIIPDAGGNKVLIATGNGSTYTTAGTYIIDAAGKSVALFTSDGVQIGINDGTQSYMVEDEHGIRLYDADGINYYNVDNFLDKEGYAKQTFTGDGVTDSFQLQGMLHNYSGWNPKITIDGEELTSGWYLAEDAVFVFDTPPAAGSVIDIYYHPEYPFIEKAFTFGSRKDGSYSGKTSFVAGRDNEAEGSYQTVFGRYNDNNQNNAFEIGNGSASSRSNAFEVDWNGNTTAAGDITDGSGNVLADKADTSAIPTVNDATLTIQKNGADVQTFSANAASNKTANITVPTKTSDLTNDGDGASLFATLAELADKLDASAWSSWLAQVFAPLYTWYQKLLNEFMAQNQSAVTLTNAAAKVTLGKHLSVGSDLSISSGGIQCAKAGMVEASASARMTSLTASDLARIEIRKGTTIQKFQASRSSGNTVSVTIAPLLISVAAGDVINLYAFNGTAARGSLPADSGWLTVKYVG